MENGQESETREQGESQYLKKGKQPEKKKERKGKGKKRRRKKEKKGGKEGGKKRGRKERWKVWARMWRWEPLCTAGGNVKWCSHCEQQHRGASKTKHRITM